MTLSIPRPAPIEGVPVGGAVAPQRRPLLDRLSLPGAVRGSGSSPEPRLALTEVHDHVTYTASAVTAWYALPQHQYAFRPDAEVTALFNRIATQVAGLAGHRLHLRRTTRPFPVAQWAEQLDRSVIAPVPADPARWGAHLASAVAHLLGGEHFDTATMLGVEFPRRTFADNIGVFGGRLRRQATPDPTQVTGGEHAKVMDRVAEFDRLLADPGLAARPAHPLALAWLLHRSVGIGLTPPPRPALYHDPGDVLALTEDVYRFVTPYGATVRFYNKRTGENRYVAVLTAGRMEPITVPEMHLPWMHAADQVPFPVEISSRVTVLSAAAAAAQIGKRLRLIRSQENDYAEHGIDPPLELPRLAERALEVGDELEAGRPADGCRVHGHHRFAVYGDSQEECLDRAAELRRVYDEHLRMSLQHPKDQGRLAAEFIPGEPVADTGYLRRMPVKVFAAALPQAASNVGDHRGDLIGHTAGDGRRPVFFDPHLPMEVAQRSGLGVIVAEPGGGKSTLLGALAYLAVRRGTQATLVDPSGLLARLAQLPELDGYTRVLNLAGAQPGTLSPYALVPTPHRWEYPTGVGPDGVDGDLAYQDAVGMAQMERFAGVVDTCIMLLPPQVVGDAGIILALQEAVRKVPLEESSTLEDVVHELQLAARVDDAARHVAGLLEDASRLRYGRLFFGSPPPDVFEGATLTILTMAGLQLPDMSTDRQNWSTDERLAFPILHAAMKLAVRRCYGGDRSRRKLIGLDEAHIVSGWPSGRDLFRRLARDSRKFNLASLLSTQNPKDIVDLDVANLLSVAFVGRIAKNAQVAADALEMLGVERGVGYEADLAELSPTDIDEHGALTRLPYRGFIMRDAGDRLQTVRVDVSYVPGLMEALDTNPGGPR